MAPIICHLNFKNFTDTYHVNGDISIAYAGQNDVTKELYFYMTFEHANTLFYLNAYRSNAQIAHGGTANDEKYGSLSATTASRRAEWLASSDPNVRKRDESFKWVFTNPSLNAFLAPRTLHVFDMSITSNARTVTDDQDQTVSVADTNARIVDTSTAGMTYVWDVQSTGKFSPGATDYKSCALTVQVTLIMTPL